MASEEQFRGVIAELLAEADGSRYLFALERTAAFFAMDDGSLGIVIHPTRRDDDLLEALRRELARNPRTHHKLIMVGGTTQMQPILTACQPGTFSRRMVQVYQLLDDGTVWSGRSSRLDSPVGRALEAVAKGSSEAAPSFEALAKTIRRPTEEQRKAHVAQRAFVRGYQAERPLWTYGAVAFLLGVFGLQLTWGGGGFIPTLIRMGANTDAALGAEPWRLLSSVALHGGWLHIAANGFMLYVLGGHIERIFGWARLILLLVVAGLLGGLLSALFRDALLSVGASGAIFGTLGAAATVALRPQGLVPPNVALQLRHAAFLNLGLNAAVSFLPGVDFLAHLGGGLAGIGLVASGLLTRGLPPVGSRTTPLVTPVGLRVAAWGGAALLVGSVVLACVVGRPWELAGSIPMQRVSVGDSGFSVRVPASTPAGFEPLRVDADAIVMEARATETEPYFLSVTILPFEEPAPLTPVEREAFLARKTAPDEGATLGPRRIIEGSVLPSFEEVQTFANGALLISHHTRFDDAEVVVAVVVFAEPPAGVWGAAQVSAASLERVATPGTLGAAPE